MAERDIVARLRLAGEQFSQELNAQFDKVPAAAEHAGNEAGNKFSSGFATKMAGLTVAGVAAVALVGEAVGKAFDYAKEVDEASRSLHVNAERLQEWRQAARSVGASSEELDASLGELNSKIRAAHDGNRDAQQSFVDLGVGFDNVNGRARDTDAVFSDVIERLSKIEDPTKRAETATKLLGDEFDRLLPMAQGGADGLNQLEQSARDLGVALSSEEIKGLNDTNAKLEQMRDVLSVKISTVVAENADAISYLIDKVTELGGSAVQTTAHYMKFIGAVNQRSQAIYDINKQPGLTEAQRAAARAKVDKQLGFEEQSVGGFWGAIGFKDSKYVGVPKPVDYFGVDTIFGMAEKARNYATSMPAAPTVSPKTTRSGGSRARTSTGKTDEQRAEDAAAKKRADEIERAWDREQKLSESIGDTIKKQQDSARVEEVRATLGERAAAEEEARLSFERQHPEALAQSAAQLAVMLGITQDIATANKTLTAEQKAQLQADIDKMNLAKQTTVKQAGDKADAKAAEEQARRDKELTDKWQREHEQAVRDVAYLYEDLFSGGTERLFKDFKTIGLRVVSEVAAQWTLATISGQSVNLEQVFNSSLSQSPLGSLFGLGKTVFGTSGAANDNAPSAQFQSAFGDLGKLGNSILPGDQPIGATGTGAIGAKSGSLLNKAGFALAASSIAQMAGIGGGGTGSQLGGLAGSIGGQALGSSLAALGSFGGPVGAVAGAVLGSVLGGVFDGALNPNRSAGAHLTSISSMSLGGKDSKNYGSAGSLGDSVVSGIKQIADALGATTGSFNTTIGVRGGDYRVNTSGTSLKIKNGATNYGTDSDAAISAAIQDAIRDGVLVGISKASQNILASGQDLEEAITKASLIESIPKLLKQRLDPLGAALDEVNDKYKDLAAALKEGGASLDQITQAQQLYQLEIQDTVESVGAASATLKDFLSSLTIGSSSPLSLRQQEAAAREALAPYEQQIAAAQSAQNEVDRLKASGGTAAQISAAEDAARAAAGKIDQDKFQQAASALLSIERAMEASTGNYFDEFDRIKQLTNNAIALVEAGATSATDTGSDPFSELIASATKDTANILTDQTGQLNTVISQLQALNDNLTSSGALSWIAANRGYA